MEAGAPVKSKFHPSSSGFDLGVLQFVEVMVTEGYVTAELRKKGFIGVAYCLGAKLGRSVTKVVHLDPAQEWSAQVLASALKEAPIIYANISNGVSQEALKCFLDIMKQLPNDNKRILLLFRKGSNHRCKFLEAMPYLHSGLLQAGSQENPSYRRQALYHNVIPQHMVVTNPSKGTVAGDGMPRSWAQCCATWLSTDMHPLQQQPSDKPKHPIKGQPCHNRARLLSEFSHVETVAAKEGAKPGDKVAHQGDLVKVLNVVGGVSQNFNDEHADSLDKEAAQAAVFVPDKSDFAKEVVESCLDSRFTPRWMKIGIWRSPQEFIDKAKTLIHPFDHISNLPDELLEGLHLKLGLTARELALKRLNTLQWLRDMKAELRGAEAELKASMHVGVRAVVENRQILLIEKLLIATGFNDTTAVIDAMKVGVDITESVPFSKSFPPRYDPPQMSSEQLLHDASIFKEKLESNISSYGSRDLDEALENKVQKDLDNGWAVGPFTREGVDDHIGSDQWIPSRRFPVVQAGGSKVRAIDDYTESGWNFCVGVRNKWTQHTLDEVVLLGSSLPRVVQGGRSWVPLGSGTCLQGDVAASGSLDPFEEFGWKGCTVDLESAFRQLPLHPKAACASPLCYYSAKARGPRYICLRALPFGSVASVAWFLRYAKALWYLGVKLLHLSWLSFFDDYILLELSRFSDDTLKCVLILLKLLGVPVASDKLSDLSFEFAALGVQLHLLGGPLGHVRIANKEGRIEEAVQAIRYALSTGRFTAADVQKARGKLGFISGFVSSKVAAFAVAKIKVAGELSVGGSLSSSSRCALEWLLGKLPMLKPKVLGVSPFAPVLVFSDASDEDWGVGGVLIDVQSGDTQFFSSQVPADVVRVWGSKGSLQLISQAEAYAAVVCFHTWAGRLADRRVLHFLDNVAAEAAFVGLSSRSGAMEDCIRCMAEVLDEVGCMTWFCRCPSQSNPADEPSRRSKVTSSTWKLGAVMVDAVHPNATYFVRAVRPKGLA